MISGNALRWMFLLLAAPTLLQAAEPPVDLGRLLEEEGLPGITWSLLDENGSTVGASGLADVAKAQPMAVDTRVQVGSVTKTVLALGVLRLISEQKLSLDTNVEQLLPMLNWRNPWRDEAPVRIRHLLEHTAGLDNIRMWQFLNSSVGPDSPLVGAFPPQRRDWLRVRSRPGSQYSYSNMGYALLGLVIERVTGLRYEAWLDQSLLQPLAMDDSSFQFVTQALDPRLAMGYLDDLLPQPAIPMVLRPAGQYTTTAGDMSRLMVFALGDGSIDNRPFISPVLMAQLGRPSGTDAVRAGLEIGHGLALAGRDRHGVFGFCHPGTTFGFRAYLCLFPDQGKGFFYAINADQETANYERFNRFFIARLGLEEALAAPSVAVADELAALAGLYAFSPNNMAQFAWLDWMFNSLWVREQGDSLVVLSLQGAPQQLLPLGEGLFRRSDRRQASHVFSGDPRTLSNGLATYRRVSPVVFLCSWASLLAGGLGWTYLVFRGGWLALRGRPLIESGLQYPLAGLLGFLLPAILYSQQSFLAFGERTAANVSVAALTALLPLLLAIGLIQGMRRQRVFLPDILALVAALQLCLVLLLQGVLPLMFWK